MTGAKPRPPLIPGETRVYPVLPVRDIVVFPHMIAPLFVGRKKSILALEEVMRSDTFILLATQKSASEDDPATEAIYEVGTLAEWKYFKTIDMAVGETPRWGVSTEKALEAIEKDGFYLTTGQIRLKKGRADAPKGVAPPAASRLSARVASPNTVPGKRHPTTFHRLIDHRNHLNFDQLFGLS